MGDARSCSILGAHKRHSVFLKFFYFLAAPLIPTASPRLVTRRCLPSASLHGHASQVAAHCAARGACARQAYVASCDRPRRYGVRGGGRGFGSGSQDAKEGQGAKDRAAPAPSLCDAARLPLPLHRRAVRRRDRLSAGDANDTTAARLAAAGLWP